MAPHPLVGSVATSLYSLLTNTASSSPSVKASSQLQTVSGSLSLTHGPLVFACSHCIQQILEAVLHCHQMGVVHRDLKVSRHTVNIFQFLSCGLSSYNCTLRPFLYFLSSDFLKHLLLPSFIHIYTAPLPNSYTFTDPLPMEMIAYIFQGHVSIKHQPHASTSAKEAAHLQAPRTATEKCKWA